MIAVPVVTGWEISWVSSLEAEEWLNNLFGIHMSGPGVVLIVCVRDQRRVTQTFQNAPITDVIVGQWVSNSRL